MTPAPEISGMDRSSDAAAASEPARDALREIAALAARAAQADAAAIVALEAERLRFVTGSASIASAVARAPGLPAAIARLEAPAFIDAPFAPGAERFQRVAAARVAEPDAGEGVAALLLFEAGPTDAEPALRAAERAAAVAADILGARRRAEDAKFERRRLLDALSVAGDGLIIYDENDRVIACFHGEDGVYPHLVETFTPGRDIREAHEEILDTLLVLRGEERDAWLDKRVRHAPDAPFEGYRETRAGKFGLVRDRYTSSGARVTRVTDVTELTKQAKALEEALDTVKKQNRRLEEQAAALERARRELRHQAHHDALTGLANRRRLEDELEARCAAADRTAPCAILHVDLDYFKQINDTLGHRAGDNVLTHVANILRSTVSEGDFVARTGGDEFVILTAPGVGPDEAEKLAETLIERLSQPIMFEGEICKFSASIGIAFGAAECVGCDSQRILASADLALYEAKAQGRNRSEVFRESMRASAQARKSLSDQLFLALERDEFFPVYQPQIVAATGAIRGVEALARWRHPERGVLAPAAFLPWAERLGLLPAIDRKMLAQVARDERAWRAQGVEIGKISVNITSERLSDPALVDEIEELDQLRGRLCFEILESVFVDQLDDRLRHALDRLNELGVEIEIDDFGMGHSSIMGLLSLGPRRLKIPREFIAPLPDSERHAQLVRFVLDIARSLQIEAIAEGVETDAQRAFLCDAGCQLLQGYLFAKPMPSDAFLEFFAAERRRAAG